MKITWGRYPPYFATCIILVGLITIIFLSSPTAKLVIFVAMLVLTLLHFMHFVIETPNYYIFCYSLIFVVVKNKDGAYVEHDFDHKYCDRYVYHIEGYKPKSLFVYGEKDKIEFKKTKKIRKNTNSEFNYVNFFKENKKNAIKAYITENKTNSRIGGKPDLPQDFKWPIDIDNDDAGSKEVPYDFLMQIDLSEINKFDTEGILPKSGYLSVFAKLTKNNVENNRNLLKIYYFNDKLSEFPPNFNSFDGTMQVHNTNYLDFKSAEQVPYVFEAENLANKLLPEYLKQPDSVIAFGREDKSVAQILGYAVDINHSSLAECTSSSVGDNELMLLLSINLPIDKTCESRLFVYIAKTDLEKLDFSNITCDLQTFDKNN